MKYRYLSAIQSVTKRLVKYKRNRPLVIKVNRKSYFNKQEDGIRMMQMQPVGSTDDLPQIPEPDGSYMYEI